jgi:hypothetical protein
MKRVAMADRLCFSFYWPNYGREGELFPILSRHPVHQAWRVADEPVFGGTISVLYMAVKADYAKWSIMKSEMC